MNRNIIIYLFIFISLKTTAQENGSFTGIDVSMDNLYRLSKHDPGWRQMNAAFLCRMIFLRFCIGIS
jgi:hypothetical protein